MINFFKKMLVGSIALAAFCAVIAFPAQAKAKHTVTFIYGTKTNVQQVPDGGNAIVPTDTGIVGYTFLGWTDTCMNVKADKLILGMYVNNTPYAAATNSTSNIKKVNDNTSAPFLPWWDGTKGVPGVTCVVRWYNGHNNELWKTQVVPYGSSLPDPADPCVEGYEFVGWEGSWKNITEDRAIKAWYYRTNRVRFYSSIDGSLLDTQWIRDGDNARECHPYFEWHRFIEYSDEITNITHDKDILVIYD
ncbi:MAG: InlB B-repeat-containing protein [Lachnospiraceae bacterium]|nr:InlB B-repeat-containing protein [Lachnospiraceae bacterium]